MMAESVGTAGAPETEMDTDRFSERAETGTDEAVLAQQLDEEYKIKRERLQKLEGEAAELRTELAQKDKEIAELRELLGLTPIAKLKRTVENSTIFQKTRELGDRVKSSESFQKTSSTLSAAGQATSAAVGTAASKTGEAFTKVGTSVKESPTWQGIGDRLRSASITVKEKLSSQRSYSESPQNHEAEESQSYANADDA